MTPPKTRLERDVVQGLIDYRHISYDGNKLKCISTQENQPNKFAHDKTFTKNTERTPDSTDPEPRRAEAIDHAPVLLFELNSLKLSNSALRVSIAYRQSMSTWNAGGKPSTWFPPGDS